MLKFIKISSIFLLIYFIASCGASKEEIVIEDETAESLLEKSNAALEVKDYDKVLLLDSLLLVNFPTSDLHIDAQLNTAKALGGKEKFEDQMDLLLRILKENIIPEKVPLIYIQLAEFYEHASQWNPGTVTNDSMDWAEAAKYYRKAVFYPDSKDNLSKAKALYRAALMYAKLRQVDVARRAYEQTIAYYPDTKYAAMSKIKLTDPSNTNEIDTESEIFKEYSEDIEEETPTEETLQAEPIETLEDVGGQDIKEMIDESEQDSSMTDTPIESSETDEMSPETFEPSEQDTVNENAEFENEYMPEAEEQYPAESDSTLQDIE